MDVSSVLHTSSARSTDRVWLHIFTIIVLGVTLRVFFAAMVDPKYQRVDDDTQWFLDYGVKLPFTGETPVEVMVKQLHEPPPQLSRPDLQSGIIQSNSERMGSVAGTVTLARAARRTGARRARYPCLSVAWNDPAL